MVQMSHDSAGPGPRADNKTQIGDNASGQDYV